MRNLVLICTVLALTGCGSNDLDLAGKWGYKDRMSANHKAQVEAQAKAARQDTTPCETTLWSSGCGASPNGQKAAEIPVNE